MSDNKLTAEQVEQQIAARVEQLKSQTVTPTVEPVDEEVARREEEERREKRRADNLRRLKSPVLAQRQPDGSIRFRHDLKISEGHASKWRTTSSAATNACPARNSVGSPDGSRSQASGQLSA